MKEKMKWNDYDSLPLILDVTDIQHICLLYTSRKVDGLFLSQKSKKEVNHNDKTENP